MSTQDIVSLRAKIGSLKSELAAADGREEAYKSEVAQITKEICSLLDCKPAQLKKKMGELNKEIEEAVAEATQAIEEVERREELG